MVGRLTLADDLFNWHLKVGGSVLGCEEPVYHYVVAIDSTELFRSHVGLYCVRSIQMSSSSDRQ